MSAARIANAVKPHQGSRHWWLQRISALALAPLTLWFVMSVIDQVGGQQPAITAWIAQPWVAVGLIAYLLFAFFHADLGLQVIVEDYISAEALRRQVLLVIKAVNILAGAVAVAAVLRIAL